MPEEPSRGSTFEEGVACGFNDDWHERWWAAMTETGGNVIAQYRMRTVEITDEHVVMEMPTNPALARAQASTRPAS